MNKYLFPVCVCSCLLMKSVRAEDPVTPPAPPPDPYTNVEYVNNAKAFDAINIKEAYNGPEKNGTTEYTGYSGKGVTVAVVDGGTMMSHQDLSSKKSSLQGEEFDKVASEHGTHVAGIIGAVKADNSDADNMHGVAYNANLLTFSALLNGGGCTETSGCMMTEEVWNTLLQDTYNDVKIINNSWGQPIANISSDFYDLSAKMVEKDKLIIASAGNKTQLNADFFPADTAALKNNIIKVVSYNPSKAPSAYDFISSFSNLAGNAKAYTLAAPGEDIMSTVSYDNTSMVKYDTKSGTSMAAPVVSGTAALVQEAFPYMGGKQIADVLLSTADKVTVSPYMIQVTTGASSFVRVLYFKDNTAGLTFDQVKSTVAALGHTCGNGTVFCDEVTFADVFGQGLLNAGKAVKGPGAFDVGRLTQADYDEGLEQYFYTVNVNKVNSEYGNVWGNDIAEANGIVGLKKQGEGILTLAGNNTFSGTSVIEQGELELTGKMVGKVIVTGEGSLSFNGGTASGLVTNNGTVQAVKGKADEIQNNGTFRLTGEQGTDALGEPELQNGDFKVRTFVNNNTVEFQEKAKMSDGTLQNKASVIVSGNSNALHIVNTGNMVVNQGVSFTATYLLENKGALTVSESAGIVGGMTNTGVLSGFGNVGTVLNQSGGIIDTSLNHINNLTVSSGSVLRLANGTDGRESSIGTDSLTLSGGSLAVMKGNISYLDGERYTVVENGSAIPNLGGFSPESKLSDFITARAEANGNKLDMVVTFKRMSEVEATKSFKEEEKKVVSIIDKIYKDGRNQGFRGYYYMTADELQKDLNTVRHKVKPVQKEALPLTNVLSSQVSAHLFKVDMNRDAAAFRYQSPVRPASGYRGRSGGSEAKRKSKIWAQLLGGRVVEDGDASLKKGESKTRTFGYMFGYDHEISPHFLLGVTGGFASGRWTQDEDELQLKDYRAGVYTASRFGRFTVNSLLTGGFQQYENTRFVETGFMPTSTTASFNGYSAEFDLNLGFDFMRVPYRDYSFYLRTYVEGNVSYIAQEAYKEKGTSPILLGVNSSNNTSFSVQPGITIGYTFSTTTVTADFGYQKILSGETTGSTAYFLADTAKTPFESLPTQSDVEFFNAGIGLKSNLSRSVAVNLYGGTRVSDHTKALNFAASLSYSF